MHLEHEILTRIEAGLQAACAALAPFTPGRVAAEYKSRHNPVTAADRLVDRVLRGHLLRDGEGWLSEESYDDRTRLQFDRVWVVDPLDGTAEFVAGIPEWSVSIALVEHGRAVAGGVCNCSTGEIFLGAHTLGITCNGVEACVAPCTTLDGARVLASRSEFARGQWRQFQDRGFSILPMGSIAYKLALVAAGKADATWTLSPKHEWDIAAGVALVEAAGGFVVLPDGTSPTFNNPSPRLSGLVAGSEALRRPLHEILNLSRPTIAARNFL
jgi:myo-inositol-1(or 4)-monophosphatase